MNKYSISFEYKKFKSKGRKYIIASSEEEAIAKFNEYFKDYDVEIRSVRILEENVRDNYEK